MFSPQTITDEPTPAGIGHRELCYRYAAFLHSELRMLQYEMGLGRFVPADSVVFDVTEQTPPSTRALDVLSTAGVSLEPAEDWDFADAPL
ncbi:MULTISPECIES: hypothetical protein [unclassified Chelatococcus]|uniref:hypothetical protein n=1 Tax=unclassified Chelatococcus TaxID=2638111 RepID=UPI001BCF4590|nr:MULTISPECIES: hypothetical protein [unclassified Chelatococcus]MBS7741466.1 hypothetical protein [Chelatococcus sp. HY11]MBX3544514.1 hypothetical protein [Chelatococcus sp.]MCO5078962.1 hypothetical protein [Chelatococcus sp.]